MKEKRCVIFEIAKFIACLMVVNSHCRTLYPISYLALGGAFGNSIFFIISGYFSHDSRANFPEWIKKKVLRLFPALLIVVCIEEILSYVVYNNIVGVTELINQYWFVFALIIYMIIAYPAIQKKEKRALVINLVIAILGYLLIFVICYKPYFFVELEGFEIIKVLEYYIIYLLGATIRKYENEIVKLKYLKNKMLFLCMLLCMLIWAAVYYVVFVKCVFFKLQILVAVCIVIFSMIVLTICIKNKSIQICNANFKKIICLIAESTLEIYIVQVTYLKFVTSNEFPVALIAFWMFSLVAGCIYHKVMCTLTSKKERI